MFGRMVRAPIDILMWGPNEREYVHSDALLEEIRIAQEQAYSLAREQLKKAAERNKKD